MRWMRPGEAERVVSGADLNAEVAPRAWRGTPTAPSSRRSPPAAWPGRLLGGGPGARDRRRRLPLGRLGRRPGRRSPEPDRAGLRPRPPTAQVIAMRTAAANCRTAAIPNPASVARVARPRRHLAGALPLAQVDPRHAPPISPTTGITKNPMIAPTTLQPDGKPGGPGVARHPGGDDPATAVPPMARAVMTSWRSRRWPPKPSARP